MIQKNPAKAGFFYGFKIVLNPFIEAHRYNKAGYNPANRVRQLLFKATG